jgi:hypothetical protein
MSNHIDNIKTMLNVGVQRGIFKSAEDVTLMKDAVDYVQALEGGLDLVNAENRRLQLEVHRLKTKLYGEDGPDDMPGMELKQNANG